MVNKGDTLLNVMAIILMVNGKCMFPKGCTISPEKFIKGVTEGSSKCSATLSALKASANMILTEAPVSTRIHRTLKLAM